MKIAGIHGVPRSGTSWLAQIVNSSRVVALRFQPLFSYTHKSQINGSSSLEEIEFFYEDITNTNDQFVLQKDKEIHKNYPTFFKERNPSHLVFKHVRYHHILENWMSKDQDIRFIGLIRNPLSVISSWYMAPREFNSKWDIFDEWYLAEKKNDGKQEEFYGVSKWIDVASLFTTLHCRYPDRFLLVKYSNLHDETYDTAKSVFDFLDLPFEKSTQDFICKSKSQPTNNDPNSVFRNNHSDQQWKKNLPNKVIDLIVKEVSDAGFSEYLE